MLLFFYSPFNVKKHGVLILLLWLELVDIKSYVIIFTNERIPAILLRFASVWISIFSILIVCLLPKLGKYLCKAKIWKRTLLMAKMDEPVKLNTVKSSANFLQSRARLISKHQPFSTLTRLPESIFKIYMWKSHPLLPASNVLFQLCWQHWDLRYILLVWFKRNEPVFIGVS